MLMLVIIHCCILVSAQNKKYQKKRKNPETIEVISETTEENTDTHFNKYTVFFGLLVNNISTPSVENWSFPTTYYTESQSQVYYSRQFRRKYDHIFSRDLAYRAGIMTNLPLVKKLVFSYGVGLEVFGFNYQSNETTLEERIIDKYEVIDPGSPKTLIITNINPQIDISSNGIFFSGGDLKYNILSLCLPLSFNYNVFDDLNVSANLAITIPFKSTTENTTNFPFPGTTSFNTTNEFDTSISRALYQIGGGLNYSIMDNINLGVNYRYTVNSLFTTIANRNFFTSNNIYEKVSLTSLELRLGYSF